MTVTPPPAQRPVEPLRALPDDPGLLGLYGSLLRHLAARAGLRLGNAALRLATWGTAPARETARDRAVAAGHPSARPVLSVVGSSLEPRYEAQFTHHEEP